MISILGFGDASQVSRTAAQIARKAMRRSEDEERTGRPRHRMRSQEPPRWYPIALQLRYKAKTKHGRLSGFGQTRMMSSKDIIFDGGNGLEPGMNAEIMLEWTRLLDDRIRLQLVLRVAITGGQDGVTEARILAYEFRTRGPVEAEPRS